MNTDTYHNIFSISDIGTIAFVLLLPFVAFSNNSMWELKCPKDLEINLPPGECNIAVDYDTLHWSNTEYMLDTVFFPPSGTFFGIGSATVTLAVTTESQQLEVCEFKIKVAEFVPESLDCQSNVTVSLNGSCERLFTVAEVVEADSAGCLSNYTAARIGANGGVEFPEVTSLDIGLPFLAVVQHQSNISQCSTYVTGTGGVPPSITCPPDITVACNISMIPLYTGQPDTSGCYENLNISYDDVTTPSFCVDSFSFQTNRIFTVVDPLGNTDVCEQMITGVRQSLINVEFPPDLNGANQMKLNCSDTLTLEELTDPVFTGEPRMGGFSIDQVAQCDVVANFNDNVTNFCGKSYSVMRVWSVVNACDATDFVRDTQYIEVVDEDAPMFTLPDTVYASLSSYCSDSIFIPEAEILFECSEIFFEIRTAWDTLFTNGGWSKIGVAGANQYPITYKLTDQCGNFGFYTSILKVEDQTMVSCPPNDTIDCDLYYGTYAPALGLQDYETLNQLGAPVFHGNCDFTYTETDSSSVDACGNGLIVRKMTSDSILTDFCRQEIVVEHLSNYSVQFPADISICDHPDSVDVGNPVISGKSCENTIVTVEDKIVGSGAPGCYTLERTYRVVNSCSFDGNNLNDDTLLSPREYRDGGDGIIAHTQTIVVNSTNGPSFPNGCGFPDLPVFQNNCEVTVTVPTPTVEGCGIIELAASGDLGTEMGKNVNISAGTYVMNFTAIDECGKIGTCVDTFLVVDNTPPVAVCTSNVAISLLPVPGNPMVEVWPSDLDGGSFDNCVEPLDFYFVNDDSLVQSVIYDCCSIGFHPQTVVVMDGSGNVDSCQTGIFVQDGPIPCEDCGSFVMGKIANENDIGINNVAVKFEQAGAGFMATLNTDTSGVFFMEVPDEIGFSVTPSKNSTPLNGVTTYDAVLMTRHILNVEPLATPYQIIAADINNSGSVTTFDIVEMRKLILFIYTNFPSNSSWRFVRADYVFPNPLNPWAEQFPEVINLNNVHNDVLDLDFIGIKIGDLNGSADPHE